MEKNESLQRGDANYYRQNHVYLNNREIEYKKKIRKGRVIHYEEFVHSKRKDEKGRPMKYCHILMPDLWKRRKVHGKNALMFGIDKETGLDLDDPKRCAYIQVPVAVINKKENAWFYKDNHKTNLRVWDFNNMDAKFNVYFKGELQPDHTWKNPEPITISRKDLLRIFPTNEKECHLLESRRSSTKETEQKTNDVKQRENITPEKKDRVSLIGTSDDKQELANKIRESKRKFKKRTHVEHPIYGKGVIKEIDDVIATVQFKDGVEKKINITQGHLKKLNQPSLER